MNDVTRQPSIRIRIARNLAAQTLSIGVLLLDRLLVTGLMIRLWGVETYSDWLILYAFASLILISDLGLSTNFGNRLQKTWREGHKAKFQRHLAIGLFLSATLGLIGFCLILAAAFALNLSMQGENAPALFALSIGMMLVVARGSLSQIHRARDNFARGLILSLIAPLVTALVSAALLLMGGGLLEIALAMLFCQVLFGWCVTLLDLKRYYEGLSFRPALPTGEELRSLAKEMRWFAVLTCAPILFLQLPILLLAGFAASSATILPAYVLMRTLAGITRQGATMLSNSASVELARHEGEDRSAASKGLFLASSMITGISCSIAALCLVWGEALLELWSGRGGLFDWHIALPIFMATGLGAAVLPLFSFLIYSGLPRLASLFWFAQIALLLLLAPVALQGGAQLIASFAVAELGGGLVLLIMTAKQLHFSALTYFYSCLRAGALAALWSGVVAMLIAQVQPITSFWDLLFAAALWGLLGFAPLLYFLLPWRGPLGQEDLGERAALTSK